MCEKLFTTKIINFCRILFCRQAHQSPDRIQPWRLRYKVANILTKYADPTFYRIAFIVSPYGQLSASTLITPEESLVCCRFYFQINTNFQEV